MSMNNVSCPFNVTNFAETLSEGERKIANQIWMNKRSMMKSIGQIFIKLGVYSE